MPIVHSCSFDIQVTTSALFLNLLANDFVGADTLAYRDLPVARIVDLHLISRRSSRIPAYLFTTETLSGSAQAAIGLEVYTSTQPNLRHSSA